MNKANSRKKLTRKEQEDMAQQMVQTLHELTVGFILNEYNNGNESDRAEAEEFIANDKSNVVNMFHSLLTV